MAPPFPTRFASRAGADPAQTKNARPQGPGVPQDVAMADQVPSTEPGSTFTPGPIVEVTAMRWM